jgi:SOS response regulatory protein OraA/RecX
VPAEAVVRAGLAVGRTLDRERARDLARELRRSGALRRATRTLAARDRSRHALAQRLARAGVPAATREEALATLERAGLVDDSRVARSRAEGLAARGYGDAAIRDALAREWIADEEVAAAMAALEPEHERARLLLGPDPDARALRRLAARGFDGDVLAELTPFAEGP